MALVSWSSGSGTQMKAALFRLVVRWPSTQLKLAVKSAAHEPLPERRVARVQGRVPVGVPGEQFGVLLEAVGEVVLAEPIEDGRVGRAGLGDELRGGVVVVFLAPVHGDL